MLKNVNQLQPQQNHTSKPFIRCHNFYNGECCLPDNLCACETLPDLETQLKNSESYYAKKLPLLFLVTAAVAVSTVVFICLMNFLNSL